MTAESELVDSPSTMTPSSKAEHSSTRPPAFPNKAEMTPSPFAKPPPTHTESAPSPSQANEPLFSKPSFLMPSRREFYEGRFPPAGPGRVPSLDGRFSFHRSSSSRSTSSAGGSSDWSSFHGLMEMGPDARQEWLRANATSPSDHGWGLHREGSVQANLCVEKITASHSAPRSSRSESCSICSRSLSHRSPWASSRVMGFHECNVVAVLVCGHTFHTECLEQTTPESARQDPACPRCSSHRVALKKPAASVPSTSAQPGIGPSRSAKAGAQPSSSANPGTVPSSSSAEPRTVPSSSAAAAERGTAPSSSSAEPRTVPSSSAAAAERGTAPSSSSAEPRTVPFSCAHPGTVPSSSAAAEPGTVPSSSSAKPGIVPSSFAEPETVPSHSAKPGTVRGGSFMSRPSSRNKLSRIGALDDSANLRKPRFSSSSSDEPSP